MDQKKLTVFTPTYNRSNLLPRCYQSMVNQTSKDFIWMVIDDGSSDNTHELVEKWQLEGIVEIQYYYKENGGIHTAYNEAISHISTELCVCVDSDDWLVDTAVQTILYFWDKDGSDEIAGILGLDCFSDGKVVGDALPNIREINLIDLAIGKYKIKNGDRTNVVRTELYKKFAPMKVFDGEKFFNPHYMHLQISQEYDFLVLNKRLKVIEYQADGMSKAILYQYYNSPNSFAEIRKQHLSFADSKFKYKFRNSIHLTSSCILKKNFLDFYRYNPYKGLAILSLPFGILLTLLIIVNEKLNYRK